MSTVKFGLPATWFCFKMCQLGHSPFWFLQQDQRAPGNSVKWKYRFEQRFKRWSCIKQKKFIVDLCSKGQSSISWSSMKTQRFFSNLTKVLDSLLFENIWVTSPCSDPTSPVFVPDYYEEIFSLMYSLTCQAISPPMWEALPLICEVFDVRLCVLLGVLCVLYVLPDELYVLPDVLYVLLDVLCVSLDV